MEIEQRLEKGLAGRYRILRLLGEGGMAQVYLAEDLKHHRQVALKVLRPEISAALGRERFLREIDVAAGLNHPNILALHDSGDADGLLYFVMPFVEGESLRARLDREGSLPFADALRIAEEIGGALDYAHERGWVHRDIKPENVLFQAGHALVADLGIAQSASGGKERLTRTGMVIGTFQYMSPEQLSGDGEVDGRSDIYALGCLVHEMLSGVNPFEASTPMASLAKKLTGELESIAGERDDLPPTLQPVVARSLAVDPDERFATAGSFVRGLREASTLTAVEADRQRRRWRSLLRNTAVAAGVVGLGGLAWGLAHAMGGPALERIAVLPLQNVANDPEQEYFVQGAYADLVLEMSRTLRVTSRVSAEAVAGGRLRTKDIANELGVDGVITGRARLEPGQVAITLELADGDTEEILWSEQFEAPPQKILDLYRRATKAVAERMGVHLDEEDLARLTTSQEVDPQVYQALLQARFHWQKLTREGLDTAEDYYRQAIELSDSTSAEAWWGLSRIPGLRAQMGLITGEEARAGGDEARRRALELDATIDQDGGFAAWTDWNFAGAERLFRASLESDPTNSVTRAYFSHVLLYRGKKEEAVEQAERAVEADPYNTLVLAVYGQFLNFVRRYDEAEAVFQRVLERAPDDPISLSNFRSTYHLQGRYDDAMDIWRAFYLRGVRPDTVAAQALDRGYAQGGYRSALRAVADEFASRNDARLNWQIATLYARAGDGPRALDYLERALAVHDPNTPYIIVDPIFDDLRDEPRFMAVVDSVRQAM
jgi:TolB-like protein/Tfp pilus assembly protein PilF/tRNA A-37 threonylcarbamoyl transferase component Bud32